MIRTIVEIVSSTEDDDGHDVPSDHTSEPASPTPLPIVPMDMYLAVNGKAFQTLDRLFDFNKSCDAFICHVSDIIASKSKAGSRCN